MSYLARTYPEAVQVKKHTEVMQYDMPLLALSTEESGKVTLG